MLCIKRDQACKALGTLVLAIIMENVVGSQYYTPVLKWGPYSISIISTSQYM